MKIIDYKNWYPKRYVVTFVVDREHLLLIEKIREPFKGIVGPPGGKIEHNEPSICAAKRETKEETGVNPLGLKQCGHLLVKHKDKMIGVFGDELVDWDVDMDLWIAYDWTGRRFGKWPGYFFPSDEAGAYWCHMKELPFDKMWPSNKVWLPYVLSGYKVDGEIICGEDDSLMQADIKCNSTTEQEKVSIRL